jgi:hypothetical protein
MYVELCTWTVGIELLVAVIIAVIFWRASIWYNKDIPSPHKIKADYLKGPATTALTVLGLLVPILVALAAYLYTTESAVKLGSLATTIILYFAVLVLATWQTFALIKKATADETISLDLPQDLRFVTCQGLIYVFLILGLVYFAIFFRIEMKAPNVNRTSPATADTTAYRILRPSVHVSATRSDVYNAWGAPSRQKFSSAEYDTPDAVLELTFDTANRLIAVTERRR